MRNVKIVLLVLFISQYSYCQQRSIVKLDKSKGISSQIKKIDLNGANGSTLRGIVTIGTDRFKKENSKKLAGKLLHEYMYVYGFMRRSNKRSHRKLILSLNDVPFKIGEIIYDL